MEISLRPQHTKNCIKWLSVNTFYIGCYHPYYHLRDPAYDECDAQQEHQPTKSPFFLGSCVARQRRSSAYASHQHVMLVVRTVLHTQGFHDRQIRVNYCEAQKYTCNTMQTITTVIVMGLLLPGLGFFSA